MHARRLAAAGCLSPASPRCPQSITAVASCPETLNTLRTTMELGEQQPPAEGAPLDAELLLGALSLSENPPVPAADARDAEAAGKSAICCTGISPVQSQQVWTLQIRGAMLKQHAHRPVTRCGPGDACRIDARSAALAPAAQHRAGPRRRARTHQAPATNPAPIPHAAGWLRCRAARGPAVRPRHAAAQAQRCAGRASVLCSAPRVQATAGTAPDRPKRIAQLLPHRRRQLLLRAVPA